MRGSATCLRERHLGTRGTVWSIDIAHQHSGATQRSNRGLDSSQSRFDHRYELLRSRPVRGGPRDLRHGLLRSREKVSCDKPTRVSALWTGAGVTVAERSISLPSSPRSSHTAPHGGQRSIWTPWPADREVGEVRLFLSCISGKFAFSELHRGAQFRSVHTHRPNCHEDPANFRVLNVRTASPGPAADAGVFEGVGAAAGSGAGARRGPA